MKALLALVIFCAGCGAQFQSLTPVQKADVAINAAAQGLREADVVADAALQSCIAAEPSGLPAAQTCGQKFHRFAQAEVAAYNSMAATQHLLNAADALSHSCGIRAAIGETVTALGDVAAAATALGGSVPASLTGGIAQVGALANLFSCQAGGQ